MNLWASSKVCSKCKQDIHLDFYHRNEAKPLGVEPACRNCVLFSKRQAYKIKKELNLLIISDKNPQKTM